MNQESLEKLAGVSDIEELRQAVEALCLPFGSVQNIRLIRDRGGKECLCFVNLHAPHLIPLVIEKLGGIHYGNSVAFRIPFKPAGC
jgi:hypothetical protein